LASLAEMGLGLGATSADLMVSIKGAVGVAVEAGGGNSLPVATTGGGNILALSSGFGVSWRTAVTTTGGASDTEGIDGMSGSVTSLKRGSAFTKAWLVLFNF
jgi:hypothetical protein